MVYELKCKDATLRLMLNKNTEHRDVASTITLSIIFIKNNLKYLK